MMAEHFYKLAMPNGWDFYTGNTINYRNAIGGKVECPQFKPDGELCSDSFIYASRTPDQCLIGANIPCSAYLVMGVPVKEGPDKFCFKNLYVLKELIPGNLFTWNYDLACNPINPFKIDPPKINERILALLKEWGSLWHSVGDSVWSSVGNNLWNRVGQSLWHSVGDSVWDSVGQSLWHSVGDSVWDSVENSLWRSVWHSVWSSVGAYAGYILKDYIKWKGGAYPLQSCMKLWNLGLVSSFDGKVWRLHGKPNGRILWVGTL